MDTAIQNAIYLNYWNSLPRNVPPVAWGVSSHVPALKRQVMIIGDNISSVSWPAFILQTKITFLRNSGELINDVTIQFNLQKEVICKRFNFIHIYNRRKSEMVSVTYKFCSLNSMWHSKRGICKYASGSMGHFVFKIILREYGALEQSFIKIPLSLLELQKRWMRRTVYNPLLPQSTRTVKPKKISGKFILVITFRSSISSW